MHVYVCICIYPYMVFIYLDTVARLGTNCMYACICMYMYTHIWSSFILTPYPALAQTACMRVFMYVHAYTYMVFIYLDTVRHFSTNCGAWTCLHDVNVYVCICMRPLEHMNMLAHIQTYIHAYIHTGIHAYIHLDIHTYRHTTSTRLST
jgi:hypothetical protein